MALEVLEVPKTVPRSPEYVPAPVRRRPQPLTEARRTLGLHVWPLMTRVRFVLLESADRRPPVPPAASTALEWPVRPAR